MPTVPITEPTSPSLQPSSGAASPENLLMAAATMHDMGRLAPKGGKAKPGKFVK